jgi:hypothetical protein
MYQEFHRFWGIRNQSIEWIGKERLQAYFGEPNGCRFFSETLTAQIKSVFADETRLMGTESARMDNEATACGVYFQHLCIPLTATLSEFSGAREPNGVVGHFFFWAR